MRVRIPDAPVHFFENKHKVNHKRKISSLFVSFPHEAIRGFNFFSAQVDAFPHITSGRRPRVIGKCINEC